MDPDPALKLGRQLEAAGNLSAARAAFQKAMRLTGRDYERATAALLLAGVLEKLRDFSAAERAYEDAIASGFPDVESVAAFGLGMMRRDLGDLDGAVRAFTITLESDNRFAAGAAIQIGELLLKRGDRAGARASWARALASRDAVASARGRLRIAMLDYREGGRDAAKRVLLDLSRKAPKSVALAAAYSLGMFLLREGKVDKARETLEPLLGSGEPFWVAKSNAALRKLRQN